MAVELKGGVKAPDPTPPIYIRILETLIGYCETQGYSTQVLITSTGAIGYDVAAGPDMPLYTYIYDGPGTFLGIGLEGGQTPTYAVGDTVAAMTFYSVLGATGYPIVYTPDLAINYKGSQIAETSSSGTKILKTAGKYMEDDVEVVYTKPSGGGAGWETAPESWATGVIDKTISGSVYGSMVLTIRSQAFRECSLLQDISFPQCRYIGSGAFYGCSELRRVILPECKILADTCFGKCFKLSFISCPECLNIEGDAFFSCSSLTSVIFPKCTYIGDLAFYSCIQLSVVSFPECIYIERQAFHSCRGLLSVYFPKCEVVKSSAFHWCTNLSQISFPMCRIVEYTAFSTCVRLSSVYLPECIFISSNAFEGCNSLATVSLPKCAFIESSVFYKCYSLRSVYFLSSNVVYLSTVAAFNSTPLQYSSYLGVFGSIYVPSSLVDVYKTNTNWAYYSSRIVGYL